MSSPFYQEPNELAPYIQAYQRTNDLGQLMDDLRAFAKRTPPDRLKTLSQPFRDMPEVVIPIFEQIVDASPRDAQAMVVLANAYWLAGRGPSAVNSLASQAKAIDPGNRGAWHLWALAESSIRKRVDRWLEVTKKFPDDQLARAALADNAVSLATEEDDPVALKLAIDTYEELLAGTKNTAQRLALEETLRKLRAARA